MTEVDLVLAVDIGAREVEVYGDAAEEGALGATGSAGVKPNVGCKLNVPATITLRSVAPPKSRTPAEFEKGLRKALATQSGKNSEQ